MGAERCVIAHDVECMADAPNLDVIASRAEKMIVFIKRMMSWRGLSVLSG
jgi:hypothetical protein